MPCGRGESLVALNGCDGTASSSKGSGHVPWAGPDLEHPAAWWDQVELRAVIFAALNVHSVFQLLRRIALRHLLDLRTEKYHSGSMASHTGSPEGPFGDSGSEAKSLIP